MRLGWGCLRNYQGTSTSVAQHLLYFYMLIFLYEFIQWLHVQAQTCPNHPPFFTIEVTLILLKCIWISQRFFFFNTIEYIMTYINIHRYRKLYILHTTIFIPYIKSPIH